MTETTYDVEATADAPALTFGTLGCTDEEFEGLDADISAWSDGYNASMEMAFAGTYWSGGAADESFACLAFGTEATVATAPNGAYFFALNWSYAGTTADTIDTTSPLLSYYLPTAGATSDGELAYDSSDIVGIYYDDYSTELKYDWTTTPSLSSVTSSSTDDFVEDDTYAGEFFMPAEPDTIPDGETSAMGDRLNKGDALCVFAGFTNIATADVTGDDCIEVTLGAATLAAAGAAGLAAALAL